MSLAKVKDLLIHAQEHGYGIPAINVFDYNSIKFAAMAAEEAKMPLIIQYFPGFDVHAPLVDIRNIAVAFARRASVPIAVHLDHSRSFEIAVSGLGAGFPAVMVDGSALPYEENEDIEYCTDPELIDEKFGNIVDLVIDGGIGGIEGSTIVDCTNGEAEIVRQGKGWLDEG